MAISLKIYAVFIKSCYVCLNLIQDNETASLKIRMRIKILTGC